MTDDGSIPDSARTGPTESVDYQTPLPPGRNLRFHELPDGLRVSRDAIPRSAILRDTIVAAFAIVFMPGMFAYIIWWLIRYWNTATTGLIVLRMAVAVAIPLLSIRIFRDIWQNTGIVTEIAVTSGMLYWRKQTLWRAREYFWPLETVRFAKVDTLNRSLKVHRQKGTPLGAFSFHRMEELQSAAAQLNHAIARHTKRPAHQATPPSGAAVPSPPPR